MLMSYFITFQKTLAMHTYPHIFIFINVLKEVHTSTYVTMMSVHEKKFTTAHTYTKKHKLKIV